MPNIQTPFDLIYDNLHKLVVDSPGMQIAIPRVEDNIVSVNKDANLETWLSGDDETSIKQMLIYPSAISGNLNIASNKSQIIRSYRFLCATGREKFNESMSAVEWALLCVLVDANFEYVLRNLEWKGFKFVKNVRLSSFTSGDADTERTGFAGWAAIAEIAVEMNFPQSMMRAFARGEEIKIPELI